MLPLQASGGSARPADGAYEFGLFEGRFLLFAHGGSDGGTTLASMQVADVSGIGACSMPQTTPCEAGQVCRNTRAAPGFTECGAFVAIGAANAAQSGEPNAASIRRCVVTERDALDAPCSTGAPGLALRVGRPLGPYKVTCLNQYFTYFD